MPEITIVTVEDKRAEEAVLAPNSHHHGHVATSFSWS
ncbi:Uncharacterised protein [Actinomyces howellii]|uniref:Uncharacterized protein n=1 Tax=Actinomyces howellii TaxID=52771 RepID=A0A3S4R1K1_9ACTO|nr:Uncharacterised protein [Actinomyces howellii]